MPVWQGQQIMANTPENPHPKRGLIDSDTGGKRINVNHPEEGIGSISDLQPERKKTLRDFLKRETLGASLPRTKNAFPVDGNLDTDVSNGAQAASGTPMPLRDIQDGQAHFTLENQAKEVFNAVSSGAFFQAGITGPTRPISNATENTLANIGQNKNEQVFGHSMGTQEAVQTISEQVSDVLLQNRFSLRNTDYKFKSSFSSGGQRLTSNDQTSFDDINRDSEQYYFNNNPLGPDVQVEDTVNGENAVVASEISAKMQAMGAEAVIAASGLVGTSPENKDNLDSAAKAPLGIWADVFRDFEILNANQAGDGDYGLTASTDDLRDGTRKVSENQTQPSPSWLNRADGDTPNISIEYVDADGQPSTYEGDSKNFAYSVMNNMIVKFMSGEPFTSRQYLNSLAYHAAIFVDGFAAAAIFDALLLIEYVPGAIPGVKDLQYDNLRKQYDLESVQLAKGKARGNAVPRSELAGDFTDGSDSTFDVMELFGIPNLADLLSGPALVEFALNFMGVAKPIQSKTQLTIKGFKLGDFISFIPSFTIGSIQTTIGALKDPMAEGFWFNVGRQIARKSSLQPPPPEDGGPFGFINFFLSLREKASFRYFVTMTNLGDNAIGQFFAELENGSANEKSPMRLESRTTGWHGQGTQINPASVMANSSMFLIPKSFLQYREQVLLEPEKSTFDSGVSRVREGDEDQFFSDTEGKLQGRLPDEDVDALERILDSDYMPFYIKDLRTNEIISFHAFLDSLSDGFSATYSKTTGMGRIEPTMTYETSNRTIALGFTMVAFSPKDMDMLYWKINKLVTLLYPQFSKGTLMKTVKGKKFYQPFSQIPTASPMVRLRVGDLITSNYSMASSARMLGVGDSELPEPLLKKAEGETSNSLAGAIKAFGGNNESLKTVPSGYSEGRRKDFLDSMTDMQKPAVGPMLLSAQTNSLHLQIGDSIRLNKTFNSSGRTGKIVIPALFGAPATVKKTSGIGFPNNLTELDGDEFEVIGFEKSNKENPDFAKEIYAWVVCTFAVDIELADAQRKKVIKNLGEMSNEPDSVCFKVNMGEIKEVVSSQTLDPDMLKFVTQNTITKAFESAKGEGLAGFIENFQIDWQLGTIMWDTEHGKRAPTGCKITLGFTPIHDITPGIDADGFNRAPVYKVGDLSRKVHQGGAMNELPASISAIAKKQIKDD